MNSMNYIKYYGILLLCVSLSGCSILQPKDTMPDYTPTGNIVVLGAIGIENNELLSSEFKVTTFPQYTKGIRVYATQKEFTKHTYKKLLKSPEASKVPVTYVDSIATKPKYLQIEVIDRIALLEEIKSDANTSIESYIETQTDIKLVSAVNLVFTKAVQDEITKAEAIFLQNNAYKQYEIALVKDGKSYKQISLKEATVFDYELSCFCWGENERRKVELKAIVDNTTSCPKGAYKDADKARDKMDYFKL